MPERHVIFVNRFFHPDHSATSQLLTDLASHLSSRGLRVEVVTSRQRYDEPSAKLKAYEIIEGVTVRRVAATRFGRRKLSLRAFDYATFYFAAFFVLLRHARPETIVIALTDPPMISVIASLVCRLKRSKLINWIQDVFPEIAEASGMGFTRLLRPIRDWSLRGATANVVLGERMASKIAIRTVVRHNWAPSGLQVTATRHLRNLWVPGSPFVVGYSGNLGRVHDFSGISAAMRKLESVQFVIIGSGARLEELRSSTSDLPNVQFKPYQAREALSETLSVPDVHLISLRPEYEGLVVPSKFYAALAVGRPVIFVGDPQGEIARLIQEADCGFAVREQHDGEALAIAIQKLQHDPDLCRLMGQRALHMHKTFYQASVAFQAWEQLIDESFNG